MADLSGCEIANGRYGILSPIRVGGMATVYRAVERDLKREVAIKVMSEGLASYPGMRERFIQEAQIAAGLSHPNILTVYTFGYDEGLKLNYLVMPLVEGGTLKERLGKPMNPDDVVDIVTMIANGLGYAHARKVVHRDIKPGNILIDEGKWVRITDFGLAKLTEWMELTYSGLLGTPHYSSPEQCRGQQPDYRTDIYSLGVMIYEMLTGQVPFQGETPGAVIAKQIGEEAPSLIGVEARLEAVVRKALAKDPSKRHSSCKELASELYSAVKQPLAESKAKVQPINVMMPSVATRGEVPPELVNRQEAWQILQQRVISVMKQVPSHHQVFQFWGIAGIGKTELLRAFNEWCDGIRVCHAYIDMARLAGRQHPIDLIEKLLEPLGGSEELRTRIAEQINRYRSFEGQLSLIPRGLSSAQESDSIRQAMQAEIIESFIQYIRSILLNLDFGTLA